MGKSWLDPYLAALIAIIGIFVAFKIPYLDMPFFWDEAWVYAPAIKAMHHVGPGLLPDTITPDLTRGHPLLFHFLCSIWINVFGSSRTSLHAFALGISIGLLIVSYLLAVRLGTKQVGIGAVLMIAANEMFLAQSGILLPEVMLAFFCVLSVYFYSARKPVLFVIVAVCALMTKESAIVLILSLLCWQVYCCLDRGVVQPGSLEGRWLFIIPLPVLIASFYFVYQKVALGWFFYPAHVDMITWEPLDVIYKIKLGYVDIFEQQGQVIATYAFAFLAPVAWRWWNRWLSLLVIALYVSIGKILFGKWELSLPWTVPAILVCIAIIFWFFFRSLRERAKNIAEVASIAFIFTVGFLGFSALNFFTDRYLVCLIPFVALGIMLIMETVLKDHHHLLFPFFAGLVFLVFFQRRKA
ncbi:MAG: phospholipid carrier-dependent glycosyltransferase [Flavobacteriales bacterium]|nr:phospholipid carrier-dependent glycosyltransferase [Flavobacteriales bacterium]